MTEKRRSRSVTRFVRRRGQLTIYYKREGEEFEEEMMKVTVERDDGSELAAKRTDSLVSSRSPSSEFGTEANKYEKSSEDVGQRIPAIMKKLEKLSTAKNRNDGEKSTSSESSDSSVRCSSSSSSACSVRTAKAYNWRGEPIFDTECPRNSVRSAKNKKKEQGNQEETASVEEEVKSTRMTSPTRFPGAKSPASRQRERNRLNEIIEEHFMKKRPGRNVSVAEAASHEKKKSHKDK